MRTVSRRDHVVGLERSADAGGDGLLADTDVQEARQLAGAEALLHLLLEAADQQHLAKELTQPLVREPLSPATFPRGFFSTFAIAGFIMLTPHGAGRAVASHSDPNCPRAGRRPASPSRVPRSEQHERAALLLSPASPGRIGETLCISRSAGPAAGSVRTSARSCSGSSTRRGSAARWRCSRPSSARSSRSRRARSSRPRGPQAVAELPPDWSDLYCELELDSSDYLDRAALLLAPMNPARVPGRSAFRFRVAQQLRLRRLAADDRALPRARRRGGHHGPARRSSARSPTRTTSRPKGRSGASRARPSRNASLGMWRP